MQIQLGCGQSECLGTVKYVARLTGAGMRGRCDCCGTRFTLTAGVVSVVDAQETLDPQAQP